MASCTNHPQVVSGLFGCVGCRKPFCRDCLVRLAGKAYCAVCKEDQVRDLKSGTSELDLAGRGRRFAAAWLDGMIYGLLVYAGTLALGGSLKPLQSASANSGRGPLLLVYYIVLPLCWGFYEALMLQRNGQTLGKMAAGIKVVNYDGSDIETGQAWKRAFSRQLLAITQVLGVVDILMIFSGRGRTLHDRFGKTLVVKKS